MSECSIAALDGLVVITGASSGIGLELARLAARDGVTLILAADEDLDEAVRIARQEGAAGVETVRCDLADPQGIEAVLAQIGTRQVCALLANAGHGLGGAFLDETWDNIRHVVTTNILGTLALVHAVGGAMKKHGSGRILVTGSIAGHMPGPFQLVYNSTKAFLVDFCVGLAEELSGSGVFVTCLEPGPTDTEFFARAGLRDTKVGSSDSKAEPARVAGDGYRAMLNGEVREVSGFMNRVQALFADILPDAVVAKMHRRMAEPGTDRRT